MNSLDRAFIRAYARDIDAETLDTVVQARQSQPRRREADTAGEAHVQVSFTEGSWYRVEQSSTPLLSVPEPHLNYGAPAETVIAESEPSEPEEQRPARGVPSDVDLTALFRPPLFRDVSARSPEELAAAKANAAAIQAATMASGPRADALPTLDYRLAPPSPPTAPQVTVDDFDSVSSKPSPEDKAHTTCDKEIDTDETSESVTDSLEELRAFAEQCGHWHSVEIQMTNEEDLVSPEEAHVMVVDHSLDPIEEASRRLRQRERDLEIERQREEVLSSLSLQEVIVGDNSTEPAWLYGSEGDDCSPECDTPTDDYLTAHISLDDSSTANSGAKITCNGEQNLVVQASSNLDPSADPMAAIHCPTDIVAIAAAKKKPELNTEPAPIAEFESSLQTEPVSEPEPVPVSEPEPVVESLAHATPEVVNHPPEIPYTPMVDPIVDDCHTEEIVAPATVDTPAVDEALEPPAPAATIEPEIQPQPEPAKEEVNELPVPADLGPEPADQIETEAESAVADSNPPEPFAPAWEVDRIVWPLICDELLTHTRDQFEAAIHKFRIGFGTRTIAVSGQSRGEGRTILAICLARVAASMGLRVALVDADFDSPAIARVLSLETMGGWDTTITGQNPLSESAIASIDDHLTIVPLETSISPSVVSDRIATLESAVAEMRQTFDLVILDCAPTTDLLAEHSWLRSMHDKPSMLLAHDMRSSSEVEVQQTIELAMAGGIEIVGVAQTFAADSELV